MRLQDYIIAILVFGMVVTGFWYSYVDLGETYNVTPDEEFANAYRNISNTMEETRDDARDIREDIRSTEADQDDQYGGSLIKGAFNSLRLVWNSFTSINTITEVIQEKIGIEDRLRSFLLGHLDGLALC